MPIRNPNSLSGGEETMTHDRRTILLVIAALVVLPQADAPAQGTQQQGDVVSGRLDPTTSSAEAKAEFTAGLDDWQNQSPTTAETHFRRAIALDSGFGLAHVFAGAIPARTVEAFRSGELDHGIALAARASTAEGLFALAWRERAAHRPARSAQLFRAAMELLPNEPRLASEYVWELIEAGDNKSALDSVRAFRKRFPTFPPLCYPLAYLLTARGDSAEALAVSEEYTRLAPQSPASFAYYGRALQLRGRYAEAEAQYRRALSFAPAHPDLPFDPPSALAELYELQGRTAEARTIALEGIARAVDAPDSSLHMVIAARSFILAGEHRRALELLASARERSQFVGDGSSLRIDILLAEANALFGDRRAVPTHLARVAIVDPADSSIVLGWHAIEYAYAGQPDSALAYADHLIAGATPETQWRVNFAHIARGLAYRERRQCAQALDELRQADSTVVDVQAARAECESQLGNRAAAVMWRDRVLARRELGFRPAAVYARSRMKQMK
jgi:tetratricopeptide (TPR) repeat protein